MQLRPYQQECINICLERLKDGVTRQAVSLPVGSGKTVVFSNLIRQIPPRSTNATKALVLAHREELLMQAARQIQRAIPDIIVDIDRGRKKANPAAEVIVASVPTLGRARSERLQAYDPKRFKCIIIDEAHHSAAETYMRIIDYFRGKNGEGEEDPSDKSGDIFVWGCSATLRRHDGLALTKVFDEIVYHKPFLEMVREGWLSNMQVVTVRTKDNLDKVRKAAGDFSISSLSATVNNIGRNRAVVKAYHSLATGRKSALVFAVDVAHATDLCEAFVEYGVQAEKVFGHTPAFERESILKGFRSGSVPVLINCGILTEGTDIPNIDCIIMARPTRSPVLFQQMVGRGMRLSEEKENCLIIDFVDMFSKKSEVVTLPTLLGLDPTLTFKQTDILDAGSIEQQAREHEERTTCGAPSNKIGLEEFSKQYEELSGESREPKSLESLESLSELGFKARLHLNPLNFFDLNMPSNAGAIGKYVNDLDAISCGDLGLRQLSPFSWVSLTQSRYLLSFKDTLYFVTKSPSDGLWRATNRTRMRVAKPTGLGQPPKYNLFYTAETDVDLVADTLQHAVHGVDKLLTSTIRPYERNLLLWNSPWRHKPPTPSQVKSLRRLGVKVPDNIQTEAEGGRSSARSNEGPAAGQVVSVSDLASDITKLSLGSPAAELKPPDEKPAGITRGSATNLIIRLTHGSAKAWRSLEKAAERLQKSQLKHDAELARKAQWIN